MAEVVQQQLEESIPELHDLLAKGLFTREELREIVRRRRTFEYGLKRRQSRKEDYLKYIEYELNVEALRRKRKHQRGLQKKNSASEHSILRRIHYIFQQALKRFKYFDFCDDTDARRMQSRAFASCLRFHGSEPAIWIKAAKWEFESNRDARSARVLLQNGLRLNSESQALWLEYFRLELLHWEKLRLRAEVLGLVVDEEEDADDDTDIGAVDADASRAAKRAKRHRPGRLLNTDVEDETFEFEDPELSESESEGEDAAATEAQEARELFDAVRAGVRAAGGAAADDGLVIANGSDPLSKRLIAKARQAGRGFLSGVLPRLVAQHIMHRFPTDVGIRREMLSIYRLFPHMAASRAQIYENLTEKPLAKNPDALALLAERPLDRGADEGEATATAHALAVSAVVDDYEAHEAAAAPAAAARIHRLCLEFLHREGQRSAGSAGDAVNLLLLRAAEMEPRATLPTATADPDDDVAVATEMKANVLMAHGKVAAAQTLLARVATDSPSQRLWLAHARLALFAGVDAAAIDVIFAQAIDAVAEEEVDELWKLRVETAIARAPTQLAEKIFKAAVMAQTASATDFHCRYLEWAAMREGVRGAREALKLLTPGRVMPTVQLYVLAIEIELSAQVPSVARVRHLFEEALSYFGTTSTQLWLKYALFELQHGDLAKAGSLPWRAVKTLEESQRFIDAYASARASLAHGSA